MLQLIYCFCNCYHNQNNRVSRQAMPSMLDFMLHPSVVNTIVSIFLISITEDFTLYLHVQWGKSAWCKFFNLLYNHVVILLYTQLLLYINSRFFLLFPPFLCTRKLFCDVFFCGYDCHFKHIRTRLYNTWFYFEGTC